VSYWDSTQGTVVGFDPEPYPGYPGCWVMLMYEAWAVGNAAVVSLAICHAALLAVNPRCPEHRGNEEDDGSQDARHATGQRSGGLGKDTFGSDPKAED